MRCHKQGMFGPIELRDTAQTRELLINGQVQGGAYLEPSAASVDSNLPDAAPGPMSSSAYSLGWFFGPLQYPNGSGIMVGLGSGAGAIQLLYNFPEIDLTVIEIDPAVVDMACQGFPLIEYYLNKGRLNIQLADAEKFLATRPDTWDFACADAFTGEQGLRIGYLPLLCDHADTILLNVIDHLGGESMSEVLDILKKKGKLAADAFKAVPVGYPTPYMSTSNWILTTDKPNMHDATAFEPFPASASHAALVTRLGWDQLLASALSDVA